MNEKTERNADIVFEHFAKLIEASAKNDLDEIDRLMSNPPDGVAKGQYPAEEPKL